VTSMSLKLRDELEVIRGMDDIPLIYDPVTGSYHRITPAGEMVLSLLDGTRTKHDVLKFFADHNPARAETVRRQVDVFLTGLESSGLLTGSQLPPRSPRMDQRVRTSRLMPRVVLTRSLPVILEPVARLLRLLPARLLVGVAALGAIVGFGVGFHTLFTGVPPLTQIVGPAFLVATVLQLVVVLLHEMAHALVAQVLKTPVRGLGVALLFYFMPVAYVDRTDAYRLRERSGRVTLAMAGIMSDGWWCGITGLVALSTTGFVQHVAAFLLGIQLVGLVINLNPLLPSDGYTALEVMTGSVDARGRSLGLLKHTILRRELPPHLATLPGRAKLAYAAYGAISIAYVCFLAFSVIRVTPTTVDLAIRAVTG
jgi:putative peptide zinc metalloprotease protein